MRRYYIFQIKEEEHILYYNHEEFLYRMIRHLYEMDKKEIGLGLPLFKELMIPIDKQGIDNTIFLKLHTKSFYLKRNDDHIINKLYNDEISVLNVHKTHMLLEVNKNFSEFFYILSTFPSNFFVCDFDFTDYFFLNKIKMLV